MRSDILKLKIKRRKALLNLLLGRAGTGKTDYIMNEIKRRMNAGESGMLLIVPEQYSHDAERHLCAVCGDRLSLHAETLSFTRLCNNVLTETGGMQYKVLDAPGQILALNCAIEAVAPNLKVFGLKKTRTELLEKLLEAVKEFRTFKISPQSLESASKQTSSPLSEKLHDLALIYSAYEALLEIHGGDAAERLTLLAEFIGESSVGNKGHIFFDGFNDFTAQEISVIGELLRKEANITVCLTCDLNDNGEIFDIPRKTVTQLRRLADELGVKVKQEEISSQKKRSNEILTFLEAHLFDESPPIYSEEFYPEALRIYKTPTRYAECELAAQEVWGFIEKGFRWRDIGIMARDWEEYSSICENVFEKYGIPYFASGKVDILSKPPLSLIDAAMEITTYGWEYISVFKYLKTGLINITTEQCAILENYVLKWQIRGSFWHQEWTLPPHGYGRRKDDDEEKLTELNELRRQITEPLLGFRDRIKGESLVEDKLRSLFSFLMTIKLPEQLQKKADEFSKRGERRLSDEYTQLWSIIVNAMDQMYTILGAKTTSPAGFHELFMLALSQYDVGVIPVSLDRTPLGGMAMSRRRDLKCLIILGATDENMPVLNKSSGALSESERLRLRELGADIPAGIEERLSREMNMLYSALSLPSESLILTYPSNEGQRPSIIVSRLCKMYKIAIESPPAPQSSTLIYKEHLRGDGSLDIEFRERQQLSRYMSERLYGKNLILSATRVDRYYSCAYKHFLQNGLKLEPRIIAEFDAQTAGNFMHYLLDGVFEEIKEGIGFKKIDEKSSQLLINLTIDKYVTEVLQDFKGKSSRFEYLFHRYREDAEYVVHDMINELKNSSFEPLDLELDMSKLSNSERGFIDRVDGYEHEGKLYLRVLDYKTRKRAYSFELSDVLYGRDMQMLIYLFALAKFGKAKYKKEIEPAGVLYVPARDVILNTSRNSSREEIEKQRAGEMRRSGLILNDPAVIEAMENSPEKEYLPVKLSKDGTYTGNGLASSEQIKVLSEHVSEMLKRAVVNIQKGDCECRPYYKNEMDNACSFCEYHSVCGFDEETGDKRRFAGKMKPDEVWEMLGFRG
jgi:ATP-dependent helicase/nuclease subunit B